VQVKFCGAHVNFQPDSAENEFEVCIDSPTKQAPVEIPKTEIAGTGSKQEFSLFIDLGW
jgi:hypothetical protein